MKAMDNSDKIRSIIEALLIVSEGGLTPEDLKRAIPDADARAIKEGISLLKEEYTSSGRSFNIAEIAGRYRIVTQPEFLPWIGNLYEKEPDRLTGPSLETLAIVAYKQPATRSEVEMVRGVNCGGVLKALLDKDLICVRGRKDVAGRPIMYGTTQKFLELFGLNALDDLPVLREFREEDLEYGKHQRVVPAGEEDPEGAKAPEGHEALGEAYESGDEEPGVYEDPAEVDGLQDEESVEADELENGEAGEDHDPGSEEPWTQEMEEEALEGTGPGGDETPEGTGTQKGEQS
jgi:segregation and condensation protein B